MSHPKVSIIMATYNRGHILANTIANVMEQDYPNLELIIINDGSNDNTRSVLKSLKYNRSLIIINNLKNKGLQKSLNIGLQNATGKYIARVDDHDEWILKDKLSKQVAFLEQNPDIGLVGTAYRVRDQEMVNPLSDAEIRKQILFRCPFCHVTVLMRKTIVESVDGYDESLPYSEDWDLWLRIGTQCKMANLPDISVQLTEEDNSLSAVYFLKQLSLNRKIIQRYTKQYQSAQKAIWYHRGIKLFFSIFPLNGRLHGVMKQVFLKRFLTSPIAA